MHEMKLHVQVLRLASWRSRVARVEPCHRSEGRHNYVGMSLQERRYTMQVMLGVSLRARCDATLVVLKPIWIQTRQIDYRTDICIENATGETQRGNKDLDF